MDRSASLSLLIFIPFFSLNLSAQSSFMDADDSVIKRPPTVPPTNAGVGQCSPRRLQYKGNGVAAPPTGLARALWGGSATHAASSEPLQPSFIIAARQAKARGHHTAMYLEGPCGPTGGSDPGNEIGNCRNKFQAYNRSHPSEAQGIADDTKTRWKPFTIAQLKQSVVHKIDYCEIDNMDNSDGLMKFLRTYKTLFDRGEIYCRLILKNLNAASIGQLKEFKKEAGGVDFISTLHIKEVGGNGCRAGIGRDWSGVQNEIDKVFRELKGPGAKTVASMDTCKYESSNFTQDTVLSCPGGRGTPAPTGSELVGEGRANQ